MSHPLLFIRQVPLFVSAFIPTDFQAKIKFDYEGESLSAEAAIKKLEAAAAKEDPLTGNRIRSLDQVNVRFVFAAKLLKATIDALYESRLLIPMSKKPERRKMAA